MTGPMMPAKTSADLYPPRTPDDVLATLAAVAPERGENNTVVIRRALGNQERSTLSNRLKALEPFVKPGRQSVIVESISSLLLGFGGSEDGESHIVRAAEWARFCEDLPWWAIERACLKIARWDITAEEVGSKQIDSNWRPTIAQLHKLGAAIAHPVQQESYRISCALRGVAMIAKRQLTDEERAAEAARIGESLADFNRTRAEAEIATAAERTGRAVASQQDALRASADMIAREYRAAGIDVPPWQGDMPPTSLSMMLRLGWTITEDPHGKKILIAPYKPRDRGPTPQRAKGDLNDEIPF